MSAILPDDTGSGDNSVDLMLVVQNDPGYATSVQHLPMTPLNARFPRNSGRDVALGHWTRPSWRGRIHLIALCLAVPSLTLLVAYANTTQARIGVVIYALGLCSMLATSVTYHRWVNDLRARSVWRRVDHAMIFAAMAGSATVVALLAMPGSAGYALIALIWAASLTGAGFKLCRSPRGDGIGSKFYAGVSFLAALTLPFVWSHDGIIPAALVAFAGACYILGVLGFSRRWPRLMPATFSYHEVWHVLTVVAASAHFAAVWAIAT